MSIRNSSKSSLFLIELIIAILFFAIGSAVCVRAFVKAHDLSMRAKDLSFASAQASSAASVLEYTDGSFSSFSTYFPDAEERGDAFLVYYDADQSLLSLIHIYRIPYNIIVLFITKCRIYRIFSINISC